ncbi:hypothetical protein [Burkholderia sp. AU31652]|uniref:hypothetical protein n=1 Tax=Burkholderia sp. AU31652 TaxID=2015354 RepID=UPI00117748E5|nr:hypothetical protein [Burkholderia sp. AU31652]
MIVISIPVDITIDFTNMKVNQAAAGPTVLAEAALVGEALARLRVSRRVQQNEASRKAILASPWGSGFGISTRLVTRRPDRATRDAGSFDLPVSPQTTHFIIPHISAPSRPIRPTIFFSWGASLERRHLRSFRDI